MPPVVEIGHETINYFVGRDFAKAIFLCDTHEYNEVRRSCEKKEVTTQKDNSSEISWKYDRWKEKGNR